MGGGGSSWKVQNMKHETLDSEALHHFESWLHLRSAL